MSVTRSSCVQYSFIRESDVVPPSHHAHRFALVILSSFCFIFYVGAYMGFGPMQLMLEKDGAFSRACTIVGRIQVLWDMNYKILTIPAMLNLVH